MVGRNTLDGVETIALEEVCNESAPPSKSAAHVHAIQELMRPRIDVMMGEVAKYIDKIEAELQQQLSSNVVQASPLGTSRRNSWGNEDGVQQKRSMPPKPAEIGEVLRPATGDAKLFSLRGAAFASNDGVVHPAIVEPGTPQGAPTGFIGGDKNEQISDAPESDTTPVGTPRGTDIEATSSKLFSRDKLFQARQSAAVGAVLTGQSLEDDVKAAAANEKKDMKKMPKPVFADAAAMKEKIREAVCKKEYRVTDFYHQSGMAQCIAKSQAFEYVTLLVIAFNALWIAIDTDNNNADVLADADAVFQVVENLFCSYFAWEWGVRFLAFVRKRDGLQDAWFCFDGALVSMMVLETWVMYVVVILMASGGSGGLGGNMQMMKMVRLVRLTRMARMARLLRAIPELIILIKGIAVAARSVFFTLCLLVIIIYFFSIIFKQLALQIGNEALAEEFFSSVPHSMSSLLLNGVLPDNAPLIQACMEANFILGGIVMLFVLLAALTVMNMLIGVLCEVIAVVSSVEKEQIAVSFVKMKLLSIIEESGLGQQGENTVLCKDDFEMLLVRSDAAHTIQDLGVDVIGLVDFSDFIFKESQTLTFIDFIELILQLRGSNVSTVKDVVDLRRMMQTEMSEVQFKLDHLAENNGGVPSPRLAQKQRRTQCASQLQPKGHTAKHLPLPGFTEEDHDEGSSVDLSPLSVKEASATKPVAWGA